MATNPFFKAQIKSDWVVISLVRVESVSEKKLKKVDILRAQGAAPKNIMDIDKRNTEKNLTYADMPEKFKAEWDEHPMQGVIVGLGPKVDPVENLKVGNRVYFRGSTGEPMIYKKEFYLAIKAHDIYCVVTKD